MQQRQRQQQQPFCLQFHLKSILLVPLVLSFVSIFSVQPKRFIATTNDSTTTVVTDDSGEENVQNDVSQNNTSSASSHSNIINTLNISNFDLIGINPNSTIASDIASIYHDPTNAMVLIQMKDNATCHDPLLRGRLSGQTMALIEWQHQQQQYHNNSSNNNNNNNNNNNKWIQGTYQAGLVGSHFLEIIVLLCHNLTPKEMISQSFLMKTALETCLENPDRNEITPPGSRINVIRSMGFHDHDQQNSSTSNSPTGYWRNFQRPQLRKPVRTRYQTYECYQVQTGTRSRDKLSRATCMVQTNLRRFNPYQYYWNPSPLLDSINNLHSDLNNTITRNGNKIICALGASHSRVLANHWRNLFPEFSHTVNFTQVYALFPRNVTSQFVQEELNSCSDIVVGFGQWDAGFPEGYPTLPFDFREEMVRLFKTLGSTLKSTTRVFLRSMHYNPIGFKISMCLPTDWRSPFMVDAYNLVLKGVAEEMSITFIDTNFIIGPMWDATSDWCHYDNKVGLVEARYILSQVLKQHHDQSED